jgi:hypothetical protein
VFQNTEQGLITSVNDNGDNLSPVTTTPMSNEHLIAGVKDTGDKHKVVNFSTNFHKNLKWSRGN